MSHELFNQIKVNESASKQYECRHCHDKGFRVPILYKGPTLKKEYEFEKDGIRNVRTYSIQANREYFSDEEYMETWYRYFNLDYYQEPRDREGKLIPFPVLFQILEAKLFSQPDWKNHQWKFEFSTIRRCNCKSAYLYDKMFPDKSKSGIGL